VTLALGVIGIPATVAALQKQHGMLLTIDVFVLIKMIIM
jgi:hypothetical protein